jgi:hypothetical protein
MAKFYVGQRVRIVATDTKHAGRETVITKAGVLVEGNSAWPSYLGYEVAIPCTVNPDYRWCVFEPQDLEPILYDGNQLVSWDACLWQPQGVEA